VGVVKDVVEVGDERFMIGSGSNFFAKYPVGPTFDLRRREMEKFIYS
jgi:hypothetical protein